ncbi:choline kinase family protein [Sporosarcina sp. G11-34]|uniref:choline kinase family protein n=1 Tax=Sporosarcina sp. G11-34 TaxID=2849605 RepID=UPI0022A8D97F|nr:choline kinase family protein [Sporosarcina sp. G11-34]MCZ2258551.1 phosphotransferase [Sporosarcina sp. G11-34]
MRKVAEILTEVLDVSESEITNVQPFGGMTNINYLASVSNEHYIVRIPGVGTDQLINRREERNNLEIGVQLGINPEHIYIDTETGLKVTRMIPGAVTLTQSATKEEATMKKVTSVLRRLHCSGVQMGNQFKLYELMGLYEKNAVVENAQFYPHFAEVKKEIQHVKSAYDALERIEVPCHIDTLYENFVLDEKGKLYLIDWEYSGMFDPLWDVATHLIESEFDGQEEDLFLGHYFQREATEVEKEIILIHKIFQDYLWSMWTLFKEAKGDDFGSYGSDRFERLQRNLTLYKDMYANRLTT